MAGYEWITLTTDYGLSDSFVASCHGMIARIAPQVRVIDVTHLVNPGDVTRGARVLAQAVEDLPTAVHVAVVDPGVGTARRAIALQTPDGVLVGPDNGLLPWAADALGGIRLAVELTNQKWFAPTVSTTFHGRDIFSPVAARIASGKDLADAGPVIDPAEVVRLPDPVMMVDDGWLEAEVTAIDRFGNVQLAAPAEALVNLGRAVLVGGVRAVCGATFADVPRGELVVFADSMDQVAVAVNGGRAAVILGVAPGELLRITNH